MPGLVVNIAVQAGDQVVKGRKLPHDGSDEDGNDSLCRTGFTSGGGLYHFGFFKSKRENC